MPSLKEAAIHYAELGFYVFPLRPRRKDPATQHGFQDASCDPGTVEAWWIQNPEYNIGIATGHGLVVIDVDEHPEDGKYGVQSLRDWERENGEMPVTWTVLTGSGGFHYWYSTDENFKNVVEVIPSIDIRSLGGYVVAPPSIHPNGTPYEWEASGDPEDLKEMSPLEGSALKLARKSYSKTSTRSKSSKPYKELKKLAKGHRQDALMALQGYLKNLNLADETIKEAVRRENELKGDPPMSEEELEKEIFPFLRRDIAPREDYTETVSPATSLIPDDDLDIPTLDTITPQKAEWFEHGYIPAKSITILCGTGGTGKISIWCSLAAEVSKGRQTFLTSKWGVDLGEYRKNRKVMFFSAEDSVSVVLVEKLQKAGAVLNNIMCLDVTDERFSDIKLGSPRLDKLLDRHRPALCIFDPIQAFIDKKVSMSDRNAMRQEMEPLIRFGQKYGTTFLIVMHTNKQSNVWGRQRMADSADLWDISRSVLMVGEAGEEGYGYISQEKNSYGKKAQTVIFKNETGVATFERYISKTDKDFVLEASRKKAREGSDELGDACNMIMSELTDHNGKMLVTDLNEELKAFDYSSYIIKKAKQELKRQKKICVRKDGYEGKNYLCTL